MKRKTHNNITKSFIALLAFLFIFTFFIPASHAVNYFYDDLNRLIRADYENGQSVVYAYDQGGNMISVTPADQDALPDEWEIQYFGDLSQSETDDFDNDGLSNLDEYNAEADPTNIDTDGDGMTDGWEADFNLNPVDFADAEIDTDGDGFSNLEEFDADTDPTDPDSFPTCDFSVPKDYDTIQAAINAAFEFGGGQVCVSPGTYVENITIKDGVWLTSTSEDPADTIIDGNGIHDVVVIHGSDTGGIIGFTIQNSQQNGNFAGIKCEGSETLTIANCIIKNNNHGINFGGDSEPLIVNNVIIDNTGDGVYSNGNAPGMIYNNIIVHNGGEGISWNGQFTLDLGYNNIWENKPAKTNNGNGNGNNKDEELPGIDNISADPLFTDPDAGDYHLNPGSPCIDTGNPEYTDKDNSRSDMGVYGGTIELPEFQSDDGNSTGDTSDPDGDTSGENGSNSGSTSNNNTNTGGNSTTGGNTGYTDYSSGKDTGTDDEPIVDEDEDDDSDGEPIADGDEDVDSSDEPIADGDEDVDSSDEPIVDGDDDSGSSDEPIVDGDDDSGSFDEPIVDGDEDVDSYDEPIVDENEDDDSDDEFIADGDEDGVLDDEDEYPDDPNLATPVTATQNGKIIVDASDQPEARLAHVYTLTEHDEKLNQNGKPGQYVFKHGLVSFSLTGLNIGQTIMVRIEFPTIIPDNARCFKVDADGFYEYPDAIFEENALILSLTDGGIGDDDLIADGVITDPVGIAVPEGTSEDGGGGAGCFINTTASATPHLILTTMFLLITGISTRFIRKK